MKGISTTPVPRSALAVMLVVLVGSVGLFGYAKTNAAPRIVVLDAPDKPFYEVSDFAETQVRPQLETAPEVRRVRVLRGASFNGRRALVLAIDPQSIEDSSAVDQRIEQVRKTLPVPYAITEDEGDFEIMMSAPQGATLAQNELMAERLASRVRGYANVESTLVTLTEEKNAARIHVRLHDSSRRKPSQSQIVEQIRHEVLAKQPSEYQARIASVL